MPSYIITIVLAYLLGAVPFAVMVTRIVKGVDVREYGSKNAGATNVYRVAGFWAALAVGALDLGKGFVAGQFLPRIWHSPAQQYFFYLQIACAVAVVLWHMFTIFAGFRGGKGVLAAAGVFLAWLPLEVGLAFAIFVIMLLITKYVSVGSLCAATFLGLFVLFEKLVMRKALPSELVALTVAICALVILAHHANIARLLAGSEHKIGRGQHAR
jgi:glycerol-3-phosphate acyltransferase PlsY